MWACRQAPLDTCTNLWCSTQYQCSSTESRGWNCPWWNLCFLPVMVQSKALVTSEKGDLNYAHVVYVIYIITLKMHDGITCQARDVTVCISYSPSSWVPGNGGETKFSREADFKGQGQIWKASCCFFHFIYLFIFLMMDFISAKWIPRGGSMPPDSLFF